MHVPDPGGPVLSVVMPVKDAAATLPEQLDALLAQDLAVAWEVVAVDNGSTDATPALLARYAGAQPRLRIVAAPGATNAGAARNAGVAAARGELVAMCDADDVVGPRWLESTWRALGEHELVTGPLEVRRLNPRWLVRTRGVPPPDRPGSFHGIFPLVPAGNLGIRRSVWERLGGFDETVTANEDADLSLRAWLAGVDVHFAPGAVVHYRYRTGGRELFRQGFVYGTYRAVIARRLRDSGRAAPPRLAGWRSWLLLAAWLPRLCTAHGRASWLWVAGVRLGIARGALRARTLYL